MNHGIYKLVYSKVLDTVVPVSEAARGHAVKSSRRIRKHTQDSLTFTLLLSVVLINNAWGDTVLPAGINIRNIVDNSTRVIASDANSINFQQLKAAAVVDFNQLNLAKGQQFNVDMRPTWSMLSRIHDVNPSILNGQVNAAGNLYFVNANGIVIGKDAQFNVGSLYAGTLDITNAMFQDGFVNQETFTNPFSLVATIELDEAARNKIENAQVLVEGGARIQTANNGKVMLFAPNVKVEENAIIQTPEGQTILAAGKKIYLKGSADPAGFLVEVDSGGIATNLGKIVAERGNITMMGLAVNQSGTLSATTSVRANGSIKLIAQDKVNVVGVAVTGARNGQVKLGTGSVTEVKPDLADTEETLVSLPFKTSDVTIEASLINIDGAINVKGGNVTAKTEFDVSSELLSPATRRIYLGENASIDVSGVDAIAPMSRNQLEVQLFSDQLKDAPILRDSDLFRSTVYVDARKGTTLFDIQPFLDLRGATVAERMTNAGNVTLATNQELIVNKGASINVSGGSTTYAAGNIKETQLSFNGMLVPISEAKPGVAYNVSADTLTVRNTKWGTTETFDLGGATRFVPSYFEGNNAGTINLTTPIETDRASVLVLAGNLLANTRVSREQLLKQAAPLGGQLLASAKILRLGSQAKSLAEGFAFSDAVTDASSFVSEIDAGFLSAGFNRIDFTKVDDLTVNTALRLDSQGSLTLGNAGANTITRLNANVTAPSSDIHLQSFTTQIADNVTVSTAGIFTNDRPLVTGALTREVAANGGSITAGIMQFGQNVSLDASAGAWVDVLGGFHQGQAGNIAFSTYDALPSSLRLQSYGFEQGGKLTVSFGDFAFKRNVFVASNQALGADDIAIASPFFQQGGFSDYALKAFNVTIGGQGEPSQTVYASQQNWRMNSGFLNATGGQPMSVVAKPVTLPDFSRQAASLRFESPSPLSEQGSVDDLGRVTLAENTTLRTDRGGNVSLLAGKQVNVLGDITTPSGNINIGINDRDTFKEDAGVIFIGEQATLNAAGSTITFADSRPQLLNNRVVKAGTININQPQGSEFKGAVVVKEGAVLDVSGASILNDTKTTRGYVRETLFGDAGTINMFGSGALLVDGSFKADAQGTGRDGSLSMVFNPQPYNEFEAFPNNSGSFVVTQNKQLASVGLGLGDIVKDPSQAASPQATQYLKAQISAEQIEEAGFANVALQSYFLTPKPASQLQLADNLTLNLAGNLVLNTPQIQVLNNGDARLNAGHMTFRSPTQFIDTSGIGAGTGSFTATADQLYFDGVTTMVGINQTDLNARFDIHGQGARSFTQLGNEATQAGLIANGNINLTARQIYPESGANLSFEAVGSDSQIVVNASQESAKPILSAGGTMRLKADSIQQNGVLSAPFGAINLIGDTVTLSANSVTSVSGNNMNIPFAVTTTGGEVFNPQGGATRPLMESKIDIQADAVDLQAGATLDLSAGGDMFAYEWIPGLGGSRDVLAQPNTYAVIPNLNQAYAPRDLNMTGSSAPVMVGQTVFLNGGSGLPAGQYTLLPARYALVPGAFVVQVKPNATLLPGQILPQQDGSALTTGYFGDVATGARDAQLSTFSVYSGALFRPAAGTVSKAPSQYLLTSANVFFNDPANTSGVDRYSPLDVARLSLSASQLALASNVVANSVAGGRGLSVDISADNIRIVNEQDASDNASLQVRTQDLNALNAESVLLGGTRSLVDGRTVVNTVAATVSVENDASQTVSNRELIAAAKERISVADSASIDTGVANTAKGTLTLAANGDGALLALSSQNDIRYSREGSSALASQGELLIGANSQLNAGNSAVLDATKNVNLNGRVTLQDGGSATLGANRILIGDAPSDLVGLNVNQASLAELGNLAALTLNSYSNIDTFGSVNLGNAALNLTLNSAGIVGHATASGVDQPSVFTANNLTLKNTQNATLIASTAPASSLTLQAKQLRLEGKQAPTLVNNQIADSDKIVIQGYDQLTIVADDIRVAQRGEAVLDVAQATMTSARIATETGANFGLRATGGLSTVQADLQPTVANNLFGGQLTLQANELTVASRIEAPSGQLTLRANNNLRLANGTDLVANSQAVKFDNVSRDIAAGQIDLIADTGNIEVDAGARVSVTSMGNANAGKLNLQAKQGTVNVAGELSGGAQGAGNGGELSVDVGSLSNLSDTNARAQGFSASRTYRVRNGDVSINGSADAALRANKIAVTADSGQITVAGEVNASSEKDGRIGLYAANGLTLENTARLNANSTAQGQEGGRIDLHTKTGALDLNAGAVIDVSAGESGQGGEVYLRAPRTGAGSGDGVAVTQLASQFVGAKSTVLEAFRVFTGVNTITTGSGTGATLGFNTVANDVANFNSNQAAIVSGLGKAGDATFTLQAGTEVQSNGNLTIASDWNLYPALIERTQSDVGVLTLRAMGNLQFTGSLSDGFTSANRNLVTLAATETSPAQGLATDHTWSYRLVAGADMASANVDNTVASPVNAQGAATTGNLILNNDKVIRTGKGFIDIATGGDLRLGNVGSVIYTVGRVADALPGFDRPDGPNSNALYLTEGGDIAVQAQGNIVGAEPNSGRQLVNQWLFRQGGGSFNRDTTWWVRPDLFRQSVAALGGGNVNVVAGGDIRNFSVSVPTTARFDNFGTVEDPATGVSVVNGGGDLTIQAGRDIVNGAYLVAQGDGELRAQGSITQGSGGLGTVLALQDGQFNVMANRDVYIATTFNPTLVNQSTANTTSGDSFGGNSNFNSYSSRASVLASSVNGNIGYGSGDDVFGRTSGLTANSGLSLFFGYNPSKIEMTSFAGDLSFGRLASLQNLVMLPAADGNLSLLAANDIRLANIKMSDADPAALPGINTPLNAAVVNVFNRLLDTHSPTLLHANDTQPALIIANQGDIRSDNRVVAIPKATRVVAGNDISNINIALQNNRPSDVSLIKAGRDVNTRNVVIGGPGELLVQAGRNIDLIYPEVTTINSTGNAGTRNPVFGNQTSRTFAAVANPALPSEGASITLQAGLGNGANVDGYVNQYIMPSGAGPATLANNPQKLADYRANTAAALTHYMRTISGDDTLSEAQALALFSEQSLDTKTIFANRHLSSELIGSARDFAEAGNHDRGNNAIASLFPNQNSGDILLFNSKISTNSGGSVDMIAPSGLINVGVPGQGGDIGIITEKGGEIRAVAEGDFLVNQSKVITQFGSDIAVWSTNGTIDAGRGSKTATSVPERIVQTDAFGNTIIEVRGVAAGSGIRAQSYDPDGPNGPLEAPLKGNVFLTAPIVDAGEAGIEAGDLLIVAPVVLNAANIQVQGASSGVPVAATSSLAGVSAGLSPDAVNSATQAMAQSVAQSASNAFQKPKLPSIISVDVISIGQ